MRELGFPRQLIADYWTEVRRILVVKHRLSKTRAKFAVMTFRKQLREAGVGDIIYHASCERTAEGIITGEYWKYDE